MGLITKLKDQFRDGALHRWHVRSKERSELLAWAGAGRPIPPPAAFKKKLIRDVAQRFGIRVLVETGTLWGNTVAASLGAFETIYSIELHDVAYERAQRRFARHPKVKLAHGDSTHELIRILAELEQPALFWLDAHYSGIGTARAGLDTPIVGELEAISQHSVRTHAILVDDARCFDGSNDYPTVETCRTIAARHWPKHGFNVEDDIIQIVPAFAA